MQIELDRGFSFPVGYRPFHKDQLFNFQLNRPFSLGYVGEADLAEAGGRIGSFADWRAEMLQQAEKALSQGRLMNAAFFFRAAEFYTLAEDPDKNRCYDRFFDLFHEAFAGHPFRRVEIPYEDGFLPAMELRPERPVRGTILLHGGFDSFIEEFYSLIWHFAECGYRVIGFDGPGQGGARRRFGLPLDFRWEGPVKAVMDHLALEDVTLIGLSMGGYFAMRAASLEPRVRRVIVSGHAYDYMKIAPAPAAWLMTVFARYMRGFTNKMSLRKVRQGGREAWEISHLMYVLDVDEPMAAMDFVLQLNEDNLRSDQVRQDVMVLASEKDHFIPIRLHQEQLKRLTSARSLTDRVFTEADQAQNHCQIGNMGLALRVMTDWIDSRTRRDLEPRGPTGPAGDVASGF